MNISTDNRATCSPSVGSKCCRTEAINGKTKRTKNCNVDVPGCRRHSG